MIRFSSSRVWIWLAAPICLLIAILLGLSSSSHVTVSGHLTASVIGEIRSVVRQENFLRWRSLALRWSPTILQRWVANISRPIKSIDVTTNNLHELNKRILSSLAAQAATNPAVEVELQEMEMRMRKQPDAGNNQTVEVWYADKNARWGQAGYTLEKGSNGWKATIELFQ